MGHAAESYTLLTIGDGLVAQIPALVISTAAGVIVTRVSTDQDVGEQMVGQLFSNPRVMLLAAAVLGLLGLVPGMPNLVFLLFTAGLLGLAWWMRGRESKPVAEPAPVKVPENTQAVEATWNDVQLEDSLGMEVGYRLIPMVDFQQDGELLGRIRSIRKKFAQDMGFLPPVVHIRDNMIFPQIYRASPWRSQNLPPVLVWISRRLRPITFPCAAIKTPPLSAGVAGSNSAVSCSLRTSLTAVLSACSNCMNRYVWRTGSSALSNCRGLGRNVTRMKAGSILKLCCRVSRTR